MIMLLAAVVVAGATPAPAAKPVDPAAMAAARALVQQLGIPAQLQKVMTRNVEAMRSGVTIRAMLAQQPGFVPAYQANQAKFDPVLQKAGVIQAEVAEKVMREATPAVIDATVRVYASTYSAAELKGLADFYKTPLGTALWQRDNRLRAQITQASDEIVGARLGPALQANAARINAALAPLKTIAAGPAPAPAPAPKK